MQNESNKLINELTQELNKHELETSYYFEKMIVTKYKGKKISVCKLLVEDESLSQVEVRNIQPNITGSMADLLSKEPTLKVYDYISLYIYDKGTKKDYETLCLNINFETKKNWWDESLDTETIPNNILVKILKNYPGKKIEDIPALKNEAYKMLEKLNKNINLLKYKSSNTYIKIIQDSIKMLDSITQPIINKYGINFSFTPRFGQNY